MLYRNMFLKYYAEAGSDGAEGGGSGGVVQITPEIQALIDAQVSGLKGKNSELLGKLKEQSDSLKRFEGIDPDAVRNIMKRFADDEEAKLIAEGKIDDVLNKRTERMRTESAKEIDKAMKAAEAAQARAAAFTERLFNGQVGVQMAKAGAFEYALEDSTFRAGKVFTVNDAGELVAKEGVFGKNGQPLQFDEWVGEMKEKAPHWWPAKQGSGTQQGSASGSAPKSLSECKTDEQRIAWLKANT